MPVYVPAPESLFVSFDASTKIPQSLTRRLCQELVGHGAHDVDGLLLSLDDVAGLGILGQALERAHELACSTTITHTNEISA